ncbi:MAG TPA: hypothetical protein ENG62_00435, partial [Thermoplasmatales archaeon]|nr:hypothetical protein [Thermoplasmatales archaeon]
MDRKRFALLLILLWVIMGILVVNDSRVNGYSTPIVIYVDDDNTNGPWDGTIEHPYRCIQQAIDNASLGDTIIVEVGEYRENVYVDKSLSIIGVVREETIVDGGGRGDTVSILARNVTLCNLTIKDSGEEYWFTAGIRVCGDKTKIKNCIISDNNLGIFVKRVVDVTICGNIFYGDGLTFSIYD